MARVLEERPVGLSHQSLYGPGPFPHALVFNGEVVLDRVVGHAPQALDDLHVFRRPAQRILPVEVGRFHDERVTFPSPSRHAHPLTHLVWWLRASIERNDPSVVNHLSENHHETRRLTV